ncbi:MAG: DUF4288 domain-containing protein [Gemmatimonadales bacterium]|nr:DUF4288 domain-containing protein [Gemmatimonadales bacterium]
MEDQDEDWYAARVLFVSRIDGSVPDDALYEERLVLVRARSLDDAQVKARRYGIREGHEYRNERGNAVTWQLHSVNEVAKVREPQDADGWDVWSRFLREGEVVTPSEPD